MSSPKPLTSIEAFALALVEASSRLDAPVASDDDAPAAYPAGIDEEPAAPAAE